MRTMMLNKRMISSDVDDDIEDDDGDDGNGKE